MADDADEGGGRPETVEADKVVDASAAGLFPPVEWARERNHEPDLKDDEVVEGAVVGVGKGTAPNSVRFDVAEEG